MDKIIGGAVIEVGKCMADPIKRQFNYLCCFNTNTQNLKDEAGKLDDAKVGVQGQVDAARRNNEVIVPRVETWLDDVNKIQADMNAIEPEILKVKSDCLAIKSRFSLSRKATKMAEAMKELQDDHDKFGQISHLAPPPAMASIPLGQTYELESRSRVEEDIIATLKEKKVRMMGICGMGGVGKTTMAKKIRSRAREEGLFDEIVMAVVSQPVDMLRIQKEMAELLGLDLKVESVTARAHHLRARLMNTTSILIILDDLWKGLDLEELGIPDQRELKECTILLTSRNMGVFSAMSVGMTFQIKILSEIEAWSLFKEKVGDCADDQSLFPAAQEIVRECNGLPIALVTVGDALKDKTSKFIWEDAVQELKSSNPQDIPDFLAQVYNPLKLSYDLLQSEHAKSIFLMCCLFPEDRKILISNLSLYAWGLGLVERKRSMQVARNKVQTLVEMLKSHSLLVGGDGERFIKMHDVVRDVGIFIAAKKGLIDPNLSQKCWPTEEINHSIDCTWISLFDAQEIMFPVGSMFPNLHFLLFEGSVAMEELPLQGNFFESAGKLYVLSIKLFKKMKFLPNTIQCLKHLRTLVLESCSSLEDISIVGELVSLEILYCQSCGSIKELPIEIGRLNQLKLLHISFCTSLKTIAAGVISRLVRLEELSLVRSFNGWESRASEGKNACLSELNCLSSLTTLIIEIDNASLVAEQIHLPNLVEFNITIGKHIIKRRYEREMRLQLEREVVIGDWIHQLLRSTENLALRGERSNLVPLLPQFTSFKWLNFDKVKMARLIDGRSSGPTTVVFPLLEYLHLRDIDDLEEIHNSPISSDHFKNLQEIKLVHLPKLRHLGNVCNNISSIYIGDCCSLRSVFPWNNYFPQLKSLTVVSCSMLEQVVMWAEGENGESGHGIKFPKLEELILHDLPRVTTFCKGIYSIEFPSLTRINIVRCPNLKNLVSSMESDYKKYCDDDSFHLVCKPDQAEFGSLKNLKINGYDSISSLWRDQLQIAFFTTLVDLTVSNCGNIKSLFSLSIATNLVSLRNLFIESCCEMVNVIEDEEAERSQFIKLKELRLKKLPKLKAFCDWSCVLHLPSLIIVFISECPLMERFPFGILSSQIYSDNFKNLESIEIRSCSIPEQVVLWNEEENEMEDINGQSIRITFPKLKKLHLHDLPKLASFCKGTQSIEFPILAHMEIVKCPMLKSLVSPTENDHKKCSGAINHDADYSLHLFCKSEAAFGRLKRLRIDGYESIRCDKISMDFFTGLVDLTVSNCGNIKSLFSISVARNLVNLGDLCIESCREMVKVIEDGEVEMPPIFIKLEYLTLIKLPKLKAFCDWRCALHLPSLRNVDIKECPEMERFSFGSLTTPNLKIITKNGKRISDYTKDLNDALFGGDFLHLDILFGSDQ